MQGIGFSDYVRRAMTGSQMPPLPILPAVPFPVIQHLHQIDGRMEAALQRVNGYLGWLYWERRTRLPIDQFRQIVVELHADLADAKAQAQSAILQARTST